MDRTFFVLGAVVSALAVAMGAFGAHTLRGIVAPDDLSTYETAARYHMYHGLGLLGVAWSASRWPKSRVVRIAGWLFLAGVLLFSGSLYALSVTRVRFLGAITPLGGVSFFAGWVLLAWAWLRRG